MIRQAIIAVFIMAVGLAGGQTQGQQMRQQGPAAPVPTAQNAASAPGLGEIMSLQQMRHLKLWFAGSGSNWELAAYELDELKEGFEDISARYPMHDDIPLLPMIEAISGRAIPDLATAVEARDAAKFTVAFDALTAGCNGCHRSAKKGFIVIQRPTGLPYTNQSFAPTSP
jgi:hypothetical protein